MIFKSKVICLNDMPIYDDDNFEATDKMAAHINDFYTITIMVDKDFGTSLTFINDYNIVQDIAVEDLDHYFAVIQ